VGMKSDLRNDIQTIQGCHMVEKDEAVQLAKELGEYDTI